MVFLFQMLKIIKKTKLSAIKHILFLILLPFSVAFSQTIELGVPFFENISPQTIGYGGANYSISQDMTGTMYFGNFNGIITYNNLVWDLEPFSGKPVLFSDKIGQLFVGGFNTIAQIHLNAHDKITYESLIDSAVSFGQIQTIEMFRNQVFFVAQNTLYKISKRVAYPIVSDSIHLKIFTDRDVLYISKSDNLYVYDDDAISPLLQTREFTNTPIYDIFRFGNGIMLRTKSKFYTLSASKKIKQFITEIDDELQLFGYSCAKRLSNNTLVIGTYNNGLYFIDEHGQIINYLNVETGLFDNTIHDLFIDKTHNLWVGFSNGIARVEVPSAFTYFSMQQGLPGSVNSIVRHNGSMYFGTQKGVYKLVKTHSNAGMFEKIKPEHVGCNILISYNDALFSGTKNGLYLISGSKSKQIFNMPIVAACAIKNSNAMWVATSSEVYKLDASDVQNPKLLEKYTAIQGEIQTIAHENDTVLWIGTHYDGLYQIVNNSVQKIQQKGLSSHISWIEVFPTSLGVLFSTSDGLFRYDNSIRHFYADSKISIPYEYTYARIRPIVEDIDKNLWLTFESQGLYTNQVAVGWNTNNLERYTLITSQFNKLSKFICNTIYPDENSVVWFGGFDGLVRLDFKQLSSRKSPEQTYIHTVIIGEDSLYDDFKKSGSKKTHEFAYNYNTIRFEFASPVYEGRSKLQYSYRLEGYQDQWSAPTESTYKEFSNLPAGVYVFSVRAIDFNSNYTVPAEFNFAIDKHPLIRWWAILLYMVLAVSLVTAILRWRAYQFVKEKAKLSKIIQEKTEELLVEKEKTETLLSNILPEETAKELKEKGRASSMRFNMATILFSDIHGFTKIAEEMNPDALIDELDKFFLEFDTIVEKHNIEKIKTIGDAYMCAGGIPQKNRTNPIEVVVAALEMQSRIQEIQKQTHTNRKKYWELRIGIHTGPIIAGVVGSKKFSYDIWGDSVNIASRMESSGEVGKVNISESTFLLVQDFFDCEHRGKIPVKYKGEVDMYFVNGFKAEYSDDPQRIIPNKKFNLKFALLKFEDLQEMMFERFEKELPKNLYYHNLKHTIDVVVQTEIIGLEEKVSDEEMLLLKTAALFHDAGFLLAYMDHEDLGAQLVKSILPRFNFTEEQIQQIVELILVTKLPHKPKNLLEKIMCDADLDYLGRDDYFPVSRDLYRELIEHSMITKSEYEWNKMQIKFLQNHRFFTESSKRRRNENKNKQIQKLQEQTRSFNKINL